MSDLLNCPFCGGEAEWKSGGPGCAWVSCKDCPAETGDGTIDRVKKSWNNRTPDRAADLERAMKEGMRIATTVPIEKVAEAFAAALAAFDKTDP